MPHPHTRSFFPTQISFLAPRGGYPADETTACPRKSRYRTIFENAVEGIFQTTPDGQFIRVNAALARICGYDSPEELVREPPDIGRQLYVELECRDAFRRVPEEHGTVSGFETQIYRKDGARILGFGERPGGPR